MIRRFFSLNFLAQISRQNAGQQTDLQGRHTTELRMPGLHGVNLNHVSLFFPPVGIALCRLRVFACQISDCDCGRNSNRLAIAWRRLMGGCDCAWFATSEICHHAIGRSMDISWRLLAGEPEFLARRIARAKKTQNNKNKKPASYF